MFALLTDSRPYRRVDAAGATLSQSKPRFPPIRHLRTSIPWPSTIEQPTIIIRPGIKALAHSLSISNDLANVLDAMSSLTAFMEVPRHGSTMTRDIAYFDDERASIEDRILAMAGEEDKPQGVSYTENVQEPCRLVALIYANMVFRELQPSSATHTTLISRLKTTLMQANLMSCWGILSEALLWVLFMGGAVAQRDSIRSWFVSVLTMVCTQLKIQSWHDIKEVLLKYLWCDRIWEERCKNLWLEVDYSRHYLSS